MNIVNIVILLVAILALGISLYTLLRKEPYTEDKLLSVDPQGSIEILNKLPLSFQSFMENYLSTNGYVTNKDLLTKGYVKDGDFINLGSNFKAPNVKNPTNPSNMLLGSCDAVSKGCNGGPGLPGQNITIGSHPDEIPYQKGNNTTWMVFNITSPSKPK